MNRIIRSLQEYWFNSLMPFEKGEVGYLTRLCRSLTGLFKSSSVYKCWKSVDRFDTSFLNKSHLYGSVKLTDVPGRASCLCQGWVFHPEKEIKTMHIIRGQEKFPVQVYGLVDRSAAERFPVIANALHSGFLTDLPQKFDSSMSLELFVEVQFVDGKETLTSFKTVPESREFLGVPL